MVLWFDDPHASFMLFLIRKYFPGRKYVTGAVASEHTAYLNTSESTNYLVVVKTQLRQIILHV